MTHDEFMQVVYDNTTTGLQAKLIRDAAEKYYTSQNSGKPVVSGSLPPSDELRTAVEKLLLAVKKHHPQMNMETQLDLYMSYHDVKKALGGNDR